MILENEIKGGNIFKFFIILDRKIFRLLLKILKKDQKKTNFWEAFKIIFKVLYNLKIQNPTRHL